MAESKLEKICKLIHYDILTSTTKAGSGHPTSSLSSVELMASLFFNGFLKYDLKNPDNFGNDRVIFSKGHAAPLLYSLYHVAGAISQKELMSLRQFDSPLEGHPTPRFKYVDVATGSLGQGLSVGVGMALGIKKIFQITNNKSQITNSPRVFVLLGDSELSEGQNWEAMASASYFKLNNLIGILDVSRLGQTGKTMLGWDIDTYVKRIESFGWKTIVVEDGHDLKQLNSAYCQALFLTDAVKIGWQPIMILAKTIKGKGISFLEDKDNWHGKPLNNEQLKLALKELGKVDLKVKGEINVPNVPTSPRLPTSLKLRETSRGASKNQKILNKLEGFYENKKKLPVTSYELCEKISTRQGFADALVAEGEKNPELVVIDAELANSTLTDKFGEKFPDRFFQVFIAEQNMASVALGLSKIGFNPLISTYGAFLTRAFDQVRMAQYSNPNLKIVGSHAGVHTGADGPSQMGLEDIAMMRSILNSIILYPSDAVSASKLTTLMINTPGIVYLRNTRNVLPVIYSPDEKFEVGGSKTHNVKGQMTNDKSNSKLKIQNEKVLIITAGATVHEALKAQKELAKKNIETTVLDCYCIKPLDQLTIQQLTINHHNVIVVEDHYPSGGLGEAVLSTLTNSKSEYRNPCLPADRAKQFSKSKFSKNKKNPDNLNFEHSNLFRVSSFELRNFMHLCVNKLPLSGSSEELLRYAEIDSKAIIKTVLSSK